MIFNRNLETRIIDCIPKIKSVRSSFPRLKNDDAGKDIESPEGKFLQKDYAVRFFSPEDNEGRKR